MKTFSGKSAIVTGGANGIGKQTAILLAQRGAHVIVADMDNENGEACAKNIRESGGSARFIHLDIADKAAVDAAFAEIHTKEGALNLAVNNAGIGGVISPLHEVKEADWNRMMAINLTGQFYCLQAQLKAMLVNGGGSIVNVSSLAGVSGVAYGGPYSAAKHGLVSLTKTAAKEYGSLNIRVNAVCPGFIETDLIDPLPDEMIDFTTKFAIPMKRIGQPEEVAQTIAYLLSDDASYITGSTIYLDGGLKAG